MHVFSWLWSRLAENVVQGARLSSAMCGGGFTIELGKRARRGVTFHLAIPVVIRPSAKFGGDLRWPFLFPQLYSWCKHNIPPTYLQEGLRRASQIICG